MKGKIHVAVLLLILIGSVHVSATFAANVCEQHDFGDIPGHYWVYSDGRSWDFPAENTMTVQTIQIESELASLVPGTFHIEVWINGNAEAEWDQFVNHDDFRPYSHSADVNVPLVRAHGILQRRVHIRLQ
jgi:hypothetical protein